MQVATINIPVNLNNGQPCAEVYYAAVGSLIKEFGGCTRVEGRGFWNNGKVIVEEPMHVVTVAMDDNSDNRDRLSKIARTVAVGADQDAVYVVHANGTVEFVTKS